jgi:hypothetical protein
MSGRPFEGFTDQQLSDYCGDVDARTVNGDGVASAESAIRAGERRVAEVNARRGRS